MQKRGSVLLILFAFAAVACASLAHVTLRLGVVRLGYAIGERTRERDALLEERRKLETELAALKRPDRIEKIAREQLQMDLPDPSRIRTLRNGPLVATRDGEARRP